MRVGSKKDGKEGFDGGCHQANRYQLPPSLPPTKYVELEKVRTNEKWGLVPELLGRQEEVQNSHDTAIAVEDDEKWSLQKPK